MHTCMRQKCCLWYLEYIYRIFLILIYVYTYKYMHYDFDRLFYQFQESYGVETSDKGYAYIKWRRRKHDFDRLSFSFFLIFGFVLREEGNYIKWRVLGKFWKHGCLPLHILTYIMCNMRHLSIQHVLPHSGPISMG